MTSGTPYRCASQATPHPAYRKCTTKGMRRARVGGPAEAAGGVPPRYCHPSAAGGGPRDLSAHRSFTLPRANSPTRVRVISSFTRNDASEADGAAFHPHSALSVDAP